MGRLNRMFTTGWHGGRTKVAGVPGDVQRDTQGRIPVHQASILFTFMVLVMGGVWLALTELGGSEAQAAEPAAVIASAE